MDTTRDKTIKELFWEGGNVLISATIMLRTVEEDDKDLYLEIQGQNFLARSMLKDEEARNILWEEHTRDYALMCSILVEGRYVGYCGINNVKREKWEIAIELLQENTNQGIGYLAISGFVKSVRERLGVSEFRIRMAPGNIASQKLFEKIGAVPNGISSIFPTLNYEDDEDIYLGFINDNTIAVAEKFGVEPKKLLSHFLEYNMQISLDRVYVIYLSIVNIILDKYRNLSKEISLELSFH